MKLTNLFESPASLMASIRITRSQLDDVTLQDILSLARKDALVEFDGFKEGHDYLSKITYNEKATKPSGTGFVFDIYAIPLTKGAVDMMSEHGAHFQAGLWLNYQKLKFQSDELNSKLMSEVEARAIFPDHKF